MLKNQEKGGAVKTIPLSQLPSIFQPHILDGQLKFKDRINDFVSKIKHHGIKDDAI